MAGALDLRRARACFKDMNGRLEEFRSWSASRKRSDAVSCDGSRAVLLTDSEVCARREAREEQIRVALWDRAQQLLEARRTERLELRDTLSAETARTKGDVNARVGAALKAAADGVAKARSSKEKLKAEAERLRGELARKRELEEQEQDEEDERVARENAQANKRQRTTDEDPQTRIRTMMELIASGKERISALGTDTINAKREREAEEAVVAEHKRELESLRVQSGAYEGERSLAELMDQVRQDRKAELASLEARTKGDKDGAESKRDAVLKHLISFLKDDACSPEQMSCISDLLASVYSGKEDPGQSSEQRKAAAAALYAKTGLSVA